MPSPFPGMNPYLEHPALWSGVHHRLISAIASRCPEGAIMPVLSEADAAWVDEVLRQQGLR